MAATGYTPIKLYASSTPSAVPLAINLDNTNGAELAINIADGKLFYKDSGGTVQVLAVTLPSGVLPIANGGTGQTTASAAFNALSPVTSTGDLIIGNGTNSATRLAIGTNGYVLTSNGTTASWQASTGGVTSFSGGTTGLLPSSSTTGAITLSGTLVAANGGTGLTSPGTSGNVLTSNGSGWVSSAPAASGVSQAQAIAYSMTLGF